MELPATVVLLALPKVLQSKIRPGDFSNESVVVSLDTVFPQLPRGMVKVTFGELRRAAPHLFLSGAENDETPVVLPLDEVLSRLDASWRPHRPGQKCAPESERSNSSPSPVFPLTNHRHKHPRRADTKPHPNPTEKRVEQEMAASGSPTALPQAVADPGTPASQTEATLLLPLAELAKQWPKALRLEIAQSELQEAKIELPAALLERGLGDGKIVLTWRELRSRTHPKPSRKVSMHDRLELEISTQAVASLLRQSGTPAVRAAAVGDGSAPNAFHRWVAGHPTPPRVKPQSPCNSPEKIVLRATALRGVAGALVALPDGLPVASHLLPPLKGDVVAAFLPQLFSKVGRCTKEFGVAEPDILKFTADAVAWAIFRRRTMYLAVVGHAGHPLPTRHLAMLASELE